MRPLHTASSRLSKGKRAYATHAGRGARPWRWRRCARPPSCHVGDGDDDGGGGGLEEARSTVKARPVTSARGRGVCICAAEAGPASRWVGRGGCGRRRAAAAVAGAAGNRAAACALGGGRRAAAEVAAAAVAAAAVAAAAVAAAAVAAAAVAAAAVAAAAGV